MSKLLRRWRANRRRTVPELRWRVLNRARQAVLADSVAVADRGEKRRKGLLGRDHLSSGEGLWIVPCEAVHTFGMRFPIDLVYLDRERRVKKVRSSVPPWRFSACLSAHSVLELAAGAAWRAGVQPGDRLEFSAAELSGDSVADAQKDAIGS